LSQKEASTGDAAFILGFFLLLKKKAQP